jgi:glycosyltransferase involved in cell wall biosynthesis
VVLPTRDRPAALEACLAALDAQTIADSLEVIVVDDGSVAPDTIAHIVARHPRASLVRQSGAGPAAARNAGAREARGQTLFFTDDDCLPEADWAEELMVAIGEGADAVAGSTMNPPGAIAETSELISRVPTEAGESFAGTGNLACRKDVFESVPFDESYRRAAAEDRDWCARLVATGHTLRSRPSARVLHRPHVTLSSFLRRQVRYGEGAYRFRASSGRHLEPGRFYLALLRRGFARGPTVGLLFSLAQLATAVGWARGWLAHRRENGAASRPRRGDAVETPGNDR